MKARIPLLLLALLLPGRAVAADAADAAAYRLGPQDHLNLRVYDFRKAAGEAFPWPSLTGEFIVGADGSLSLPVVGTVRAAGSTPAELASVVGRALKQRADLTELPEASVEVVRYRPFYVVGAVQRPGRYEYQPGLTVLQAVGVAEGLTRDADVAGSRRQILSGRGDLRALEAERIGLVARQSRLAAEITDAPSVSYPDELLARRRDPRIARAISEEDLLFEAKRGAFRAELAAIDQTKVVLREEISALEVKARSLDHQIENNRRQLVVVTDLLNKGMTDRPRQLATEQTQANYEGTRLDVDVTSLKAKQDLSRADRDVIEVKARFRKGALDDAADARSRLDVLAERVRQTDSLLREAILDAPGAGGDDGPQPVYQLTSPGGGTGATRVVTEADPVGPEDVLRVIVPRTTNPDTSLDLAPAAPVASASPAAPGPGASR